MCSNTEKIGGILRGCGMPEFGVIPFNTVKERLIQCGGLRRLPKNAQSIVVTVFPYSFTPPAGKTSLSGGISRYARTTDYHVVAGDFLKRAVELLGEQFSGFLFEPFCDASPIPEVYSACLAGLGVLGQNGLLITPRFGSYIFIGEIVTDLPLPPSVSPLNKTFCDVGCIRCGRCVSYCPGHAIRQTGICAESCVSHLTQKKGELTVAEQTLIQKSGYIFGCDRCQAVCPMNKNAEQTPIDAFKTGYLQTLTINDLENPQFDHENKNRAFLWRGKAVLKRNIGIVNGNDAHTNSDSK